MCSAIQVWRIRRTVLPPIIYWLSVFVVSVQKVLCCFNSIPDYRHKSKYKEDSSCIHDAGRENWLQWQRRTAAAAVPTVHIVPEMPRDAGGTDDLLDSTQSRCDDCSGRPNQTGNQTETGTVNEHVVVPAAVSIHFSALFCRVMKNLHVCFDYTYATPVFPPLTTMRSMMAPTSAEVNLYEPSDRAITISRSVIS